MADQQISSSPKASEPRVVDCGGLQFEASFRAPAGATLRVFGEVDGDLTELLRFDDFIEGPHYHVPATGDPRPFDQALLGEPLAWYVSQIRDHLAELLDEAGFTQVLAKVDLDTVTRHAENIRVAMEACLPDGYVRVPGVGLQRSPT